MDGLQPYAGGTRPLVATVHAPPPHQAATKSPSDYLRAVRRRIWLALAVAIPVATVGTLYVLRMPPVYSVSAAIEIKPPRVDPAIRAMVGHGEVGVGDPAADEKYVPDALAMLVSKAMAEEVVRDSSLGLSDSNQEGDPVGELIGKIKTRQVPQSHFYYVTLEGRDPSRITRTLDLLLKKFQNKTDNESRDGSIQAIDDASRTMSQYISELKALQDDLASHIRESNTLAPGGRSLKEAEYETVRNRLTYQTQQVGNLRSDLTVKAMTPVVVAGMDPHRAQKIGLLQGEQKLLNKRLVAAKRIARDGADPAIKRASDELRDVEDDLAALQGIEGVGPAGPSPAEISEKIISDAMGDIKQTEIQLDTVLVEMKAAMPQYQKYVTLMSDRDLKARQLAALKERLSEFQMLAKTQKPPVRIVDMAVEPTAPIRPKKSIYIVGCIFLGMALGLGLVCFLEHLDHSVKVPEHLTAGLALPLFGVVPRIRRLAGNHRGGHLWTPGIPDSVEADAYRNLRASLLGANREGRPILTLLVTSAKAGEGKSTTALNLAATCARAGERTLLMDVDLRRPSLVDVFPRHEEGAGLVDVLRGDRPWQRTVVKTDLPNLDFLATGETRDVPIEVLGSRELKQLLISLSENHYDRVILDGPAVLGLADCRMLGRIVDAALLVVRSGSQELRSLQRAKAMLEQSMVTIAGVVFNGLSEDLQNWSSYGPNPMLESSPYLASRRPAGASPGLDAPGRGAAALMAAGTVEA